MLKDAVLPDTLRRALVIKLRHHGDVLLTSPVFSVLKARAPQLEIDALVYAETADMLTLHPAIRQVYCIDRRKKRFLETCLDEWRLLRALRARRYDLLLHLTDHPRGAWIARLCRARWAVTHHAPRRGAWWVKSFTHFIAAPNHALRHTVDRNLDALRRIGIYPDPAETRLSLVPGADAVARVARLLKEAECDARPFIHIHPGSRWHFKCWPEASMAELIGRLRARGHTVILTAAPDEAETRMIKAIESQLTQPVISFAGQLTLKELAALTANARLFIGVDSAPMHIAAAMGTPTVALFGPSGDKEWAPWQVRYRAVVSGHTCRPCGLDGCGGGKVCDCLRFLPVEAVDRAVQELLDSR